MKGGKRIMLPKLPYLDDATQTEKTIEAGEYEVEFKPLGGWQGSEEPPSPLYVLRNIDDGTVHYIPPNVIEDWKKQGFIQDDI